jgi:hypothetical protein
MYIITSAISGTFGFIFLALWILLVILTLINMFRNAKLNLENKVLWLIVIIVAPILGSMIYLFWKSVKQPE